jgi:hypothetical protein
MTPSRVPAAWYLQEDLGSVIRILVWCAHCRTYHTHGGGTDPEQVNSFMGHRATESHKPDSPFARSGYELANIGQYKTLRDARRAARTASLICDYIKTETDVDALRGLALNFVMQQPR